MPSFFDTLTPLTFNAKGKIVKLLQRRFVALLPLIFIGFTMFSPANALTPDENKKAGETFLAANAKKPNIKTTATGLQ